MNTWISIEEAREYLARRTGLGVRVAVLDSGVEFSNPVFQNLRAGDDIAIAASGIELRMLPGEGRDAFGHGTAVCDLIHRLAPEAEIGSFRVLGEQLRSRTAIIREGALQAIERGYHILNCSFGCGREDHVLLYKDWIDEAYLRGRHVVAACNNLDFTRREWPGHFPTVLTAHVSSPSGPDTFCYRPGNLAEFAARGQDLDVAWRGGTRKRVTGSSFATAHLTGWLARLLSGCPELTPLQAKALMQRLAVPWEGDAINEE